MNTYDEQELLDQMDMELEAHAYATETFEEEKSLSAIELTALVQQFTVEEINHGLTVTGSPYRIVLANGK